MRKAWKINGMDGHRNRVSFGESYRWDFSEGSDVRIIEVYNSDVTGTNDYCLIAITRNSEEECEQELDGQISDGIFENARIDNPIEISLEELSEMIKEKKTA